MDLMPVLKVDISPTDGVKRSLIDEMCLRSFCLLCPLSN